MRCDLNMEGPPGAPPCQGLTRAWNQVLEGQTNESVGLSGPRSSIPKQPLRCMARKVAPRAFTPQCAPTPPLAVEIKWPTSCI